MFRLSKISVALHRWGYDTKEYKRYSMELQLSLDAEHLQPREFLNKHQFEIEEAVSFDGYVYLTKLNSTWIGMFISLSEDSGWDFSRVFNNILDSTSALIPYIVDDDGTENIIFRDEVEHYESLGEKVYFKNL